MMTHKRKTGDSAGVNLNIVITPMLDMTFQLLFFFVLTFKPAQAMEGKMEFSLPASGEARAMRPEDVDPNKPSDADLALPAQLTVVVKTQNTGAVGDGNISALIVKSVDGEQAVPNLAALEEYLRRKREGEQISNKADIKIEADSKLKYAGIIEVMDACIRSGFERVGFNPPPDMTAQ